MRQQKSEHVDCRGGTPVTITLEFNPPITAFFGFYGSLHANRHVTMTLYTPVGTVLDTLVGPAGPTDSVVAIGHGFTSSSPVKQIEFVTGEDVGNGISLLGAFVGLAPGEPSLGAIEIPPGAGNYVLMDFAVAWGTLCQADISQPSNGNVDIDDLLVVIAFWGNPGAFGGVADVNDDGFVNVDDLLFIINAWGPCWQ